MVLQRTKLADAQRIPSTAGSLYANPSSTVTYVKSIHFFNSNSSSEAVEVYIVPDSTGSLGTADDSNIANKFTLPANDAYTWVVEGIGIVLTDTNDAIFAKTSTANKVNVWLFGDKDA